MEDNHKLCLYVSYYLSRFNFEGLAVLGYGTWESAFTEIGNILNINPHTVKNMRDQFDPLHGHRVGWYQAPLSPSRLRVAQALENLEEFQIRELVQNILSGEIQTDPNELEQLLNIVTTDEMAKQPGVFVVRGPTGRAAEKYLNPIFILRANHYLVICLTAETLEMVTTIRLNLKNEPFLLRLKVCRISLVVYYLQVRNGTLLNQRVTTITYVSSQI